MAGRFLNIIRYIVKCTLKKITKWLNAELRIRVKYKNKVDIVKVYEILFKKQRHFAAFELNLQLYFPQISVLY
jgi:hypothetical protein